MRANRRSKQRQMEMSTFKRGLMSSPFQIPLLMYLAFEGLLLCLSADTLAVQLDVPDWSIVNLGAVLGIGAFLATLSRFNDNERLETFGLLLVLLGVFISVGVSLVAGDWNLGDEIAIGAGCVIRSWVLGQSRKAEKVAIEISGEIANHHDEGEKP